MTDLDPWLSSRMGGVERTPEQQTYKVRDTAKLLQDPTSPLWEGGRKGSRRRRRQSSEFPRTSTRAQRRRARVTTRRSRRVVRRAERAYRRGRRSRRNSWISVAVGVIGALIMLQVLVTLVRSGLGRI